MVLSWLARSRRTASVDDLVARRQYTKAVDALREELQGTQPTAAERLRLADLLILAGQGEEALPILMGVADEQARFGFSEKALEALRRANEVQPGQPEVEDRIARLQGPEGATDSSPAGTDATSAAETPAETRLQEAEQHVAEGREEDALTALLLASDELARGGELDRAMAALKRAKEIQPGRPDVGRAIQKLREKTTRARKAARKAAAAAEPRPAAPANGTSASAPPPNGDDHLPELSLDEIPAENAPELELVEKETGQDLPELHPVEAAEEERPLLTEDELDDDVPLLGGQFGAAAAPAQDLDELHAFLQNVGRLTGHRRRSLGATLFADFPREHVDQVAAGLTPRRLNPGEVVVTEGDLGNSMFLIVTGSVRVLIMGGHGQPFDIRRLEAGDFFGEVAVLTGRPRTATVLAATPCETLEIQRTALQPLLKLRPDAQALLEEVSASRTLCQEEAAVRSLPPEAADPDRAAATLQSHFGRSDWSPRVRTYLARLMLDAGRQDDCLAILKSVAEDLARHGRAQKAISLLKTVETIQRKGVDALDLEPPRPGRRRSARHAGPPANGAGASRATAEAAFREWVGLLIRATDELAARTAPATPPPAPIRPDPTDPDMTQVGAQAAALRARQEIERELREAEPVR